MLQYRQVKTILAPFLGIGGGCVDDPALDLFCKECLEYLLNQGQYGGERTFEFYAQDGWITLPYELQTPLKMKIDGAVGSVWNRWFEYHWGNSLGDGNDICLCADALLTQPNRYPTVYDIPQGYYPGVLANCEEDCGAEITVKGRDATGREIFTYHNGEQIVGEVLSLVKGRIQKTTVPFATITEVSKPKTKGYVTLVGVSPCCKYRTFLSDYSPFEESPQYQRAKIKTKCPPICSVKILGRIRLKENYADDDLVPFDTVLNISMAGQTINAMRNDKVQEGLAKDQFVGKLIENEGNYKKVNNGQPLEMYTPLSGGAVKNARAAGRRLRGRWR